MNNKYDPLNDSSVIPFYEKPEVKMYELPFGPGIPFGIERVRNPEIGIGGAYGAWGQSYDNTSLYDFVEKYLKAPLNIDDRMDLAPLGFLYRHHIADLTEEDQEQVEQTVGAMLLREAAHETGWEPEEVDAVLIGMSGPISNDYTETITRQAGIREDALKVSVHKACDGSAGAMHLVLNRELEYNQRSRINLADELAGKKVLVGGIEGLSRFVEKSFDKNALQLFGNGAGIVGLIPGQNIEFLVGKTQEVYDEQGVLAVHMYYPHSGQRVAGQSMVEVTEVNPHHIRIAGLMHEPSSGLPVVMAEPMGMVKLFVRNGVRIVQDVYQAYRDKMTSIGDIGKSIEVAIVHHANLKINFLKQKTLIKNGINLRMPWVIRDFGNVSAASNMIAFLRELRNLKPGDHIMFDGFGAGTYYDVFVVALGGESV